MAAMSPTRKRVLLLIVLVGSGLIAERTLSLAGEDDNVVQPPVRSRPARAAVASDATASSPATGVRFDRLEARQRALDAADPKTTRGAPKPALFASVSWAPAPPPKPPPPPAPKPVAPPFPYSYMGGLSEDGVRTAFFNKGERVLPVKAGDTIDGTYRVEQINDQQMQVTYIPLDQAISIPFGGGR